MGWAKKAFVSKCSSTHNKTSENSTNACREKRTYVEGEVDIDQPAEAGHVRRTHIMSIRMHVGSACSSMAHAQSARSFGCDNQSCLYAAAGMRRLNIAVQR